MEGLKVGRYELCAVAKPAGRPAASKMMNLLLYLPHVAVVLQHRHKNAAVAITAISSGFFSHEQYLQPNTSTPRGFQF